MLVPRGCRLDGLKPCGSGEMKVWSPRKRILDKTTERGAPMIPSLRQPGPGPPYSRQQLRAK